MCVPVPCVEGSVFMCVCVEVQSRSLSLRGLFCSGDVVVALYRDVAYLFVWLCMCVGVCSPMRWSMSCIVWGDLNTSSMGRGKVRSSTILFQSWTSVLSSASAWSLIFLLPFSPVWVIEGNGGVDAFQVTVNG